MNRRSHSTVMLRLIGLVKPLSGYMLLAVVMGVLGHVCAALITISGAYGVLHLLGLWPAMSLTVIFAGVILFALLRAALRYGEQTCNHYIAFKLLALIRAHVFRALRRLCPAKLEGRDKGDLIAMITTDIELLEVFYAHTISPVAIAVIFSALFCLGLGSVHPLLGLWALASYGVVGVALPMLTSRLSGEDGLRMRSGQGAMSSFVLDSLRGLREILQYGQGKARLAAMNQRADALAEREGRMKRRAGQNGAVASTVVWLCHLGMLAVAAWLQNHGAVSAPQAVICVVAFMGSFGPVLALSALGATLQNTLAAGNRVLDILDEEPVVQPVTGKEEIAFGPLRAKEVSFAYDREPVLSQVSLTVPEGRIVGIAGKSGSGKSTLLRLFMRFWDVDQGEITLAGRPLPQINTKNLRAMQAFVTQDTELFQGSIESNLRIAKLDASRSELEAACRKAAIHDFIMSLPKGYDTPVGELGDTLSGGERQRIGLARAFLSGAPCLLLDEATSNLDSLNEAVILKSLREEGNDKTVVLVSHRLSTLRIAGTVYTMDQGRMS